MEYNELQKYISKRVRECRKNKKISQEKLSEKAGLGIKAIQNIENQKYDFKIKTLEKVLMALEISVEDFFDFQISENSVPFETFMNNFFELPSDRQSKLISSFNSIVKNIK